MDYNEAKRRIDKGGRAAAVAWLEEVGSWPMSDPGCRALHASRANSIERKDMATYYAIVTFGSPTFGRIRSYYRSLESARRDARELGGGSLTNVRIVACDSRSEAIDADISDAHRVVAHV